MESRAAPRVRVDLHLLLLVSRWFSLHEHCNYGEAFGGVLAFSVAHVARR